MAIYRVTLESFNRVKLAEISQSRKKYAICVEWLSFGVNMIRKLCSAKAAEKCQINAVILRSHCQ
jgi:hypothetical protein